MRNPLAAMQTALDALQRVKGQVHGAIPVADVEDAIRVLRAAIESFDDNLASRLPPPHCLRPDKCMAEYAGSCRYCHELMVDD